MSLYLCVFDGDEEVDGIDIGFYADFEFFREGVTASVAEGVNALERYPILLNHSDCDGQWSPEDCVLLVQELKAIEHDFKNLPAVEYNSEWKESVAKEFGIHANNFYETLFDVDGELLIDRLKSLASLSIKKNLPILFQ